MTKLNKKKINDKDLSIGFIGAGNMGLPMIKNLIRAGLNVKVFDINTKITKKLDKDNIIAVNNIRAIANSNFIISMLPNTKDVESVFNNENGINQFLNPGTIVIDMSTISSTSSIEIGKILQKKQIEFLDAPVSGGVKGAVDGNLSIMVGGKKETYKKSLDILNSMGKNIIYAGKTGMGQVFKMCNQIMVGSHIQAMCEAFALCKSKGGDLALLRETLIGGSANSWMLQNLGDAVISKNEKAGFRIDLQLKDLKLASEAAFEGGVPLPGLSLVLALYLETIAHNEGKNGNQALFKTYDRMTNQSK
ncbi:NAD(P)-dependent oxidoreductase [Alphaproteobacteria bacterium]|nr:NAD(P)-dependent oxidoreductase [Alphaproteobacteria bacterium]